MRLRIAVSSLVSTVTVRRYLYFDCPGNMGHRPASSLASRAPRPLPWTNPDCRAHNKMHRSYEVHMQDFLAHITGLWELIPMLASPPPRRPAQRGPPPPAPLRQAPLGLSTGAAASGTGSVTGSSGPGSPAAAKPSCGNFDGDGA